MVRVVFSENFQERFKKVKDGSLKQKIIKHIEKIKQNPEVGKPMKFDRKGTREVYVSPFRLSYSFIIKEDVIYLLDLYHKDEQ